MDVTEKIVANAPLSPTKSAMQDISVDDLYRSLNRLPIFMTELDETDGNNGENIELEAIRALVDEGTPFEIATNLKKNGNELAQVKDWKGARRYYSRALEALKGDTEKDHKSAKVNLLPEDQAGSERVANIKEICYSNRALCNLKLRKLKPYAYFRYIDANILENYRSCKMDCVATLHLNPRNIKVVYRCAVALLSLDDVNNAEKVLSYGRHVDASNVFIIELAAEANQRKLVKDKLRTVHDEYYESARRHNQILKKALIRYNIQSRQEMRAPAVEGCKIRLVDPEDSFSDLVFSVLLLYPLSGQSDYINACEGSSALADHLDYLFPIPWDKAIDYTPESIDCYMESIGGDLFKVGRRLPFQTIFERGIFGFVNNMLKLYILPSSQATTWISEMKRKRRQVNS